MSMYVDLLSEALRAWADEVSDKDLLSYARLCRRDLESAARRRRTDELLTLEVAYDRALIRLAWANGLPADAAEFVSPLVERRRLEGALTTAGITVAPHVPPTN
jgi:hypothetical protein